jgi:hypothetical protein
MPSVRIGWLLLALVLVAGCSKTAHSDPVISDAAAVRQSPVPKTTPSPDRSHEYGGVIPSFGSHGPGLPCESAEHVDDLRKVKTKDPFWPSRDRPFTDAWTCLAGAPPHIMYDDVEVSFAAHQGHPPFTRLAALEGGEVRQIQGWPAWVGQGDNVNGPDTFAEIDVDGARVLVLAQPEVALAKVVAVAKMLNLPQGPG